MYQSYSHYPKDNSPNKSNKDNQKWKVCQFSWLFQLVVLTFLISSSDGKGQKWSFQSLSESGNKTVIRLDQYKDYSLTLPLTRKSISQSSAKIKSLIEFELIPPTENHGIFAVIQSLSLRTNSDGSQKQICKDYIQFSSSDGSESNKTCGIVNRSSKTISPFSLIGHRAFLSQINSTMNVQLVTQPTIITSVETQTKESDDSNVLNSVEVTFTAFRECPPRIVDREIFGLKNCINLLKISTCIAEDLFCDTNLNCMTDLNFVGDDEDICESKFWHWLFKN